MSRSYELDKKLRYQQSSQYRFGLLDLLSPDWVIHTAFLPAKIMFAEYL